MGEWFRVLAYLALWGILIAACLLIPLGLAVRVHPLAGCLAAVLGAVLWARHGPGGFAMLDGCLSTLAFLTLVFTAVGCLAFLVWPPHSRRVPAPHRSGAAVPGKIAGREAIVHAARHLAGAPGPRDRGGISGAL